MYCNWTSNCIAFFVSATFGNSVEELFVVLILHYYILFSSVVPCDNFRQSLPWTRSIDCHIILRIDGSQIYARNQEPCHYFVNFNRTATFPIAYLDNKIFAESLLSSIVCTYDQWANFLEAFYSFRMRCEVASVAAELVVDTNSSTKPNMVHCAFLLYFIRMHWLGSNVLQEL